MAPETSSETPVADTPSYKRLTDAERILILKLDEDGLTQVEIAQRLKRSQSTVNDVLQTFADTTYTARRYLAASAHRMAENVVQNGQPRDHVAALKGLSVLHEEQAQQGITVLVGQGGMVNLGTVNPLSPPPVTETERKSAETLRIQRGSDKPPYVNCVTDDTA